MFESNSQRQPIQGQMPLVSASSRPNAWLKAQFEKGVTARFQMDMEVGAELADAMLSRNPGNRAITRANVKKYAKKLADGKFRLTHQGIAFRRDGTLMDGQHRLTAISETGIPGKMSVTFGCDPEEFTALDQGKSRTGADLLSVRGRKHITVRAALAAYLLKHKTKDASVTPEDVDAFSETLNQDDLDRSCLEGERMRKVCNPSAGALAHFHIQCATSDVEQLDSFFEKLVSGAGLDRGSPILYVREWLKDGPLSKVNNQGVTVKRAAAIIFAWNAIRSRKITRKAMKLDWPHFFSLPDAKE